MNLNTSKLIVLLRLLTEEEFKKLSLWLQSPWNNAPKKLLPFYKILAQAYPDFEEKKLVKETIFGKLFKGMPYNNKSFNNLIAKFSKEVENFLVHQRLAKQSFLKQDLLRQEFLERKQTHFFEAITKKMTRELEKKQPKSAVDYLLLSQINQALHFQANEHIRYQNEAIALEKTNQYLDAFYLLEKHRYLSEANNRAVLLKDDANLRIEIPHFSTPIIAQLNLPIIQLYQSRIQRPDNWNKQHFLAFQQLYYSFFDALPKVYQQEFLYCCMNDAIALISKGQPETLSDLFDLYQLGLKHELLFQNGIIAGSTYINIVLTACNLEKYDFARYFIKEYSTKLSLDNKQDVIYWTTAQLDYIQGEYATCIRKLKDWMPQHQLYIIQAKVTLLKAYFKLLLVDTSYFTIFKNYCTTFEQYIRRNKVFSKPITTSFLRYIQFAKRIAFVIHQVDSAKNINRIRIALEKEKTLFGKNWLEKQLNTLGNFE